MLSLKETFKHVRIAKCEFEINNFVARVGQVKSQNIEYLSLHAVFVSATVIAEIIFDMLA